MKIHLAGRDELAGLAELDADPGRWSVDDLVNHVSSLGVVKAASEGAWPLGWVAYRSSGGLMIVERLAVREDPQTEAEVAGRLVGHLGRVRGECRAADVVVADNRWGLVKTLVAMGFRADLVPNYYGPGGDGVALHLRW